MESLIRGSVQNARINGISWSETCKTLDVHWILDTRRGRVNYK